MNILANIRAYANTPAVQGQIYLSASQVSIHLGVSRVTIWRYLKNDQSFPRPIAFGTRTRRWRLLEIEAWLQSRSS